MIDLLQYLISGLAVGSVYGFVALGFVLIYSCSQVINFAQGEFVMLGAVLAAVLLPALKIPAVLVIFFVVLVVFAVGSGIYAAVIRPLQRRRGANIELITYVMATLAVSTMLSNLVLILIGPAQRAVPPQAAGTLAVAGIAIMAQRLFVIVVSVAVATGLWLLLKKTTFGLAIRAVGISRDLSALCGIHLGYTTAFVFGLAGLLGALAGVVIAPIISASAYMGLPFAIKGFIGAVVGGIANPMGALAGGIIIGLAEILLAAYVSSAVTDIVIFVLLPVTLFLRPQGLFGETA